MIDSVWKFLIAYGLLVNLCGFMLCGLDKRRAVKKQWRVPERRFFLLAFLGGGPGILAGMYTFRHKTKHKSFTAGIPAIIIAECILCGVLWWLCGTFFAGGR